MAKRRSNIIDDEADVRKQVEKDLAAVEADFPSDAILIRMCDDVRSSLNLNSAGHAANAAFHLGQLWTFRRFSRDGTFRSAIGDRRRIMGLKGYQAERKQQARTKAEIGRDRVRLLIRNGKGTTEAQQIAADEAGVKLRTVQRWCEDL